MASANSRGDSEGAGRGFIQAVAATMVVSTVLVCVLLSMPEMLLGMFQNDSEVLALAKTYCMIRYGPFDTSFWGGSCAGFLGAVNHQPLMQGLLPWKDECRRRCTD